jgi:hypothetical protein
MAKENNISNKKDKRKVASKPARATDKGMEQRAAGG